ncbi:hypothetical protein JOC77_003515 [Peribacillus deserti]|uniref:Lantibiotic n=1 Tax=Peribacillus deserti TaxID=673318 RepID=A0ABS2QLL9_9BACI|nr:hypothetical protein [Peribacillus deserti]MBM7694071.1 hypothetical protein [Peribacillus deserti]
MFDFIKKATGKKVDSGCCGVEIKEVTNTENTAADESCCGSSEDNKDLYCG